MSDLEKKIDRLVKSIIAAEQSLPYAERSYRSDERKITEMRKELVELQAKENE